MRRDHLLSDRSSLADDRRQLASVYKEWDVAPVAGWAGRPPEHRRLAWRLGQHCHTGAYGVAPGEPCWRDMHTKGQEIRVGGIEIWPFEKSFLVMIPRDPHHPL